MTAGDLSLRVVLVNGWSDLNKGDSGIIFGMVNAFTRSAPQTKLALVSEFSEEDHRFTGGYRHLRSFRPDLRIYGSLLPYTPIQRHEGAGPTRPKWWRVSLRLLYLMRSLAVLALPQLGRMLLNGKGRESLRALRNADLVVSKGGHIFYSSGDHPQALIGLYHHSYPLLLATRLGSPFAFYAQSMGPFEGRWSTRFARWLYSQASLITVREELSKSTLVSLGVPERQIVVVPDAAFALSPSESDKVPALLRRIGITRNERFIAMTVRQWFFGKNADAPYKYDRYLRAMAHLADHIVEEYGTKVVFIPQALGPSVQENDLIAAWQVYDLIENKDHVRVLRDDLSPPQLMSVYGKAYAFVGTRFHSVIFALLMGIPALAISYFGPKAVGIMNMMGLDEYVIDIGEIDIIRLVEKLDDLMQNRERIATDICERVANLHERSEMTAGVILRAAVGGGH